MLLYIWVDQPEDRPGRPITSSLGAEIISESHVFSRLFEEV